MFMITQRNATTMLLAMSLVVLAACNRTDETLGQKVDGAVNQTKEAAAQATNQVTTTVEKAIEKTADIVKEDSAKANSVLEDAAITTSINAGLAKDPDLSAFKIDVDTKAGKVSLYGSAPTTQARDRAISIAQSVKGVTSVDNQLTIKGKS
jgi:hyperosmotically inducible periplasmic protein